MKDTFETSSGNDNFAGADGIIFRETFHGKLK